MHRTLYFYHFEQMLDEMTIDWLNFTPWFALAGGVLIGLSAGLLFLISGKIAGISGITANFLRGDWGQYLWRPLFLLGLIAASGLWGTFDPESLLQGGAQLSNPLDWIVLGLGGFLVGFGTRQANGCTSGHGVCGLARLSRRSVLAVLSFMTTGGLTVFVMRHLL